MRFFYDDIKLELTDHIASEIEAVLTENKVSFNEALVTVFEKWSPQLRPSSSFWTPNNMKLPRIVLKKYKMEYKKQFITGSILALVVAISGAYLTKMISNETFFGYLRTGFQTISIVEFTTILISKYLIWKSKTNTFNSFFFQKQTAIPLLLFLLFLSTGLMQIPFVNIDFKITVLQNFMFFCYIILPIWPLKFAYHHFRYISKLNYV